MAKLQMLSISPFAVYPSVPHAGGQTYHFFLQKAQEKYDVKIISFYTEQERTKKDEMLSSYHYFYLQYLSEKTMPALGRRFINYFGKFFLNKWSGNYYLEKVVLRQLRRLAKIGYRPDVVDLEWTQFVFLAPKVKQIFPTARLLGQEADVSFLGFKRKEEAEKKPIFRWFRHRQFVDCKRKEIKSLVLCDFAIVNNPKDQALLLENGIPTSKIVLLQPFFNNMISLARAPKNHDVIFWGALGRRENFLSVEWFIQKVMPLLSSTDVRFIIVGAHPPKELLAYQNSRIVITGFVDDPKPYFANSLCLVAPLLLGAGVKVKILEGLSSGIPVLTNKIGIEGIPAENGIAYLHCETPEDYATAIQGLLSRSIDGEKLGGKAKEFILNNYNFERDYRDFVNQLSSLRS